MESKISDLARPVTFIVLKKASSPRPGPVPPIIESVESHAVDVVAFVIPSCSSCKRRTIEGWSYDRDDILPRKKCVISAPEKL